MASEPQVIAHGQSVKSGWEGAWTKPQADRARGNDLYALVSFGELGLAPTPIPLLWSEGCLGLPVAQCRDLEVCAAGVQMAGHTLSFLGSWSWFLTSENQIRSCSGIGCVCPKKSTAHQLFRESSSLRASWLIAVILIITIEGWAPSEDQTRLCSWGSVLSLMPRSACHCPLCLWQTELIGSQQPGQLCWPRETTGSLQ